MIQLCFTSFKFENGRYGSRLSEASSVRLESWIQLKPSLNWTFKFQVSTFKFQLNNHHRYLSTLTWCDAHWSSFPGTLGVLSWKLKVEGWNLKLESSIEGRFQLKGKFQLNSSFKSYMCVDWTLSGRDLTKPIVNFIPRTTGSRSVQCLNRFAQWSHSVERLRSWMIGARSRYALVESESCAEPNAWWARLMWDLHFHEPSRKERIDHTSASRISVALKSCIQSSWWISGDDVWEWVKLLEDRSEHLFEPCSPFSWTISSRRTLACE